MCNITGNYRGFKLQHIEEVKSRKNAAPQHHKKQDEQLECFNRTCEKEELQKPGAMDRSQMDHIFKNKST